MTGPSKIIYLEDRSGAETDDQCGMKYWLNRKAGPAKIGIVPVKESLALTIGRESHYDLWNIAMREDISEGALKEIVADLTALLTEDDRRDQKQMELLWRRLGWLVAFALYIEPEIRAKYETVQVEHELILDRDPLWVAVTPDRVLKNRLNGTLEYREYKTTIASNQKWMHSWFYAIQLHLGLAAVSEEIGEPVKFAQIMGLMKGYESSADHRLTHPYVWAYFNHQKNTWETEYAKSRGNDWIPMPVWEFEGGIVEWVKRLGPDIARQQFPHSPPVFLNERMLAEWVTRRTARQRTISCIEETCRHSETLRAIYFERRTRNCRPPFGDPCDYLHACWNAEVDADPMRCGLYQVREPHHEVEIVGVEGI